MNAGGMVRNPEQPQLGINLVPILLVTESACDNDSAVGFDALTSRDHRKIFQAQTQTNPRSPVVCNPVTRSGPPAPAVRQLRPWHSEPQF